MPHKIFICYRRDDSGMAGRIGDSLGVEFGHDGVFLDTDKLTLGRRFDSELLRTLNESDVFLAVIGTDWLQTLQQRQSSSQIDYVVEEIKEALRLKLSVIPLLVDGSELPDESLLPVEISSAMRWHGHNVRHESFRRDILELVQAIHSIRGPDKRSDRRSGKRTHSSLKQSLLIGGMCVALIVGGWWFVQARLKTSVIVNDIAAESIDTGPTHEGAATAGSNPAKDERLNESSNNATTQAGESMPLLSDTDDTELADETSELPSKKTTGSTQTGVPSVATPPNEVGAEAGAEFSSESPNTETTATRLVDDGDATEELQETEGQVAPATTGTPPMPVDTSDEVENGDTAIVEPERESEVPVGNSRPEENVVIDQSWTGLDGVFANEKFSLCGYDSFTISPVRNSDELLLLSDDREIPGQTFPRLRWRIKAEQPVELFDGCSAVFSYNNLAGGERIHMKVKGE